MTYSDAGRLGAEKTKQIFTLQKEIKKQKYNENPEYCLNCGKVKPFEQYQKGNKFCCRSCAVSWTNKHRDKSIYKKSSETLKKHLQDKPKKKAYCKICGAEKGACKHPEICKKYRLFKTLEKFGFNKLLIGTEKIYDEFYRVRQIIENIYISRKISDKELKENWNYTSGTANFHKILHSLNIQTYSSTKALSISYQLGRTCLINNEHTPYKQQWHTTWNNKEVYLRSSYELDYAKELDNKQIDYEVESLKIKYFSSKDNEYHCAIPDFYIPSINALVEIKSKWTLDIQEMKDKFKRYRQLGYNCVLILEHKETDLYSL